MYSEMAILTQRNDIKPMFGSIAWMVVMFCLFSALTSLGFDIWQFSYKYSTAYFQSGFILVSLLICFTFCYIFWCFIASFCITSLKFSNCFSVFFNITFFSCSSFFAIIIFSCSFSMFLCFVLFLATFLTPRTKTSRSIFSWIKLRNVFFGFALIAELCYDCLSHFNFLNKLYWLEPVSGYNPFLARLIISSQTNLSTSFWRNFQWQ